MQLSGFNDQRGSGAVSQRDRRVLAVALALGWHLGRVGSTSSAANNCALEYIALHSVEICQMIEHQGSAYKKWQLRNFTLRCSIPE